MNAFLLLSGCSFIFTLSYVSGTYVWDGRRYIECGCNHRARQCVWDPLLHEQTGSGTRCLNCVGHTEGTHCEKCKEGFYPTYQGGHCQPCYCNSLGSTSRSCDEYGRCRCKATGVIGDKCDKCQPGFYSLSSSGCKRCTCNMAGATRICNADTGDCSCKYNVEGSNCNRCKHGFYNLQPENPMGCSACFCFRHSSVCNEDGGYRQDVITSTFDSDTEGWKAQNRRGPDLHIMRSSSSRDIIVQAQNEYAVYFVAPAKFLGNQMLSYGQNLSFTFYLERGGSYPSVEDIILEGASQTLSIQVNVQNNPMPSTHKHKYNYRLHEGLEYGWKPFITSFEFQRVLSDLKAIKIRGTYTIRSPGHIDNVVLHTAQPGIGKPAQWVERCTCPTGHEGRFCEKCASDYTRESPHLGRLSRCVRCNCQSPSETCDPETGSCYTNDQSRNCPDGYYSDPSESSGCRTCPCPGGTRCTVDTDTREVICVGCPSKTMGKRCEMCEEGYFGNPRAGRPCQPCRCNNNVDPNAVKNCDQWTGECRNCLYNTAGHNCERCRPGFHGNALASNPSEKCKSCKCDPRGSWSTQCRSDGTCDCKPGVFGDQCDQCAGDTYYNSTTGCEACPNCYLGVKNKILKHKNVVRDLEILISKMKTNGRPVNDKEFEARLRKASADLHIMMNTAKGIEYKDENNLDALNILNNKFGAESYQLNNIGKSVEGIRKLTLTYESRVRNTDTLLTNVRTKIQESRDKMDQMPSFPTDPNGGSIPTVLADEARRLADRHQKDAEGIEQSSDAANKSAFKALQLITQAIKDDQQTTQSVNLLTQQSKQKNDMTEDLDDQANRITAKVERVSEKAKKNYNDLNNVITIDVMSLENEANQLKSRESAMKFELNSKLDLYETLKNNISDFQIDITRILEKGDRDNRTATLLQARANAAKYLAEDAVKKGSYTLDQVDRIINNLRDFNARVAINKTAAEDALSRIPYIIRTIDNANTMTDRAENQLGNALAIAKDAKGKAELADTIANNIQKKAVESLFDAEAALNDIMLLDQNVTDANRQLTQLETDFANKQKSVNEDTSMAAKIAGTVGAATMNAENAKDSATETMKLINDLLQSMGNPATIDTTKLEHVENSLQIFKNQWINELESSFQQLTDAAAAQKQTIAAFDRDIVDIRGDIRNLELIRDTLPTGCYNTAAVERP
ncbi:laminin subunit gamma-1-like [Leucoraja erinacea]|uniref:laminin subunit gamma-1-like n=1 Tax=Leucoraja erinaceus TaxID=7782 RepID=UPI002455F683|nr:laminin subunit gamma-1-like [Leucoraja erinacea]